MLTQTMKAVVFETGGNPEEVLRVQSVVWPLPGRDEVIVRVEARPVQPADFMFIGNRYRIKPV